MKTDLSILKAIRVDGSKEGREFAAVITDAIQEITEFRAAQETLRDRFAMAALTGDLACQSEGTGEWSNKATIEMLTERAKFLYRFADAMLEARKARA